MAFNTNKELRFKMTADKSGVDRAFDSVGVSAKKLAGTLAASLSVAAFANVIKDSIEFGDQIDKMSKRLGIAAQTLTEYKHVADLSGTSFETLAKAMQKTAQNIEMAGDGMATQKRALDALGLSYQSLKGLSIDKQFESIGNALQGVESDSKRVQLAVDLMGRAGVEVIPVFADGAEAIADMRREAQELGIAFGDDVAAKMAEADDNMTRLSASMRGLGQTLAIEVVPAINDFVVGLNGILANEATDSEFWYRLAQGVYNVARAYRLVSEHDVEMLRYWHESNEAIKSNAEEAKKNEAAWLSKSKSLGYATEVTFAAKRATDSHTGSVKKNTEAAKKATEQEKAWAKALAARDRDIERSNDELARAAERAAEAANAPWEHALENVQDRFADLLADGELTFKSLAELAKQSAAQAAAAWATQPLFNAGKTLLFGGSSAGSGGGSSGSSFLSQNSGGILSKGLGLTGISGGIDAWGAAALPSLFGTGAPIAGVVGPQLPGALAGAGIGLSSIALPVAGLALSAVLGSVFKGSRPHPASTFEFGGIGSGGSLQGLSLLSKHMDTSTAKAFSDTLSQAFAGLQGAGLNLSNIGTVQGGVNDGRGFMQLVGQGSFGFDPKDAQAANEAMSNVLLQITKSAANFSDIFEQDVLDELDALVIKGREVGDVLTDLVNIATLDVRRAEFEGQIKDEILRLTDEQAYKIEMINRQFDALLATAEGLGADTAAVEELRKLNLAQVEGTDQVADAFAQQADAFTKMADDFEKLANSLQNTLNSILLGPSSALSPQERLALAAQNYASSIGTEGQGSAATAYLDVARENYASGSQYKEIFGSVTSSLASTISQLNSNASAARMNASLYQQQVTHANIPQSDGTMLAIRELAAAQNRTNKVIEALTITARVQ